MIPFVTGTAAAVLLCVPGSVFYPEQVVLAGFGDAGDVGYW
jgi:hypothetical protein